MSMKRKTITACFVGFLLALLTAFQVFAAETLRLTSCQIIENGQISVSWQAAAETPSDDGQVYLFALKAYEDGIGGRTDYIAQADLSAGSVTAPLNEGSDNSLLFSHMALAVRQNGQYVQTSGTMYLTNPEACASFKEPAPVMASKKGLHVNTSQFADARDLGVKHAILGIPISHLMSKSYGETPYSYKGKTYWFNIGGYDSAIRQLNDLGMSVTVILLNPWTDAMPELFHPGAAAASTRGNVHYYGFNASTAEGTEALEAIASFLGERFSGENGKRVSTWIIGNEIDMPEWNFYDDNLDLNHYLAEYEKGFRILYNGIKSHSAGARVDLPFTYAWTMINPHLAYQNFGVRNYLTGWDSLVKSHGNIDWGVAHHPYPQVMTEPEFWTNSHFNPNSPDAQVVNFHNLNVLTDFMQTEAMRNPAGNVRHITLSEAGFTSQSATRGNVEDLQAAAYAYAYYIAEANPYVESFFLSRQTDNINEQRQGYHFGIWANDMEAGTVEVAASKKKLWQVFHDIDTENSLPSTEFAKGLIGISKWSDVVPGFSRAE